VSFFEKQGNRSFAHNIGTKNETFFEIRSWHTRVDVAFVPFTSLLFRYCAKKPVYRLFFKGHNQGSEREGG